MRLVLIVAGAVALGAALPEQADSQIRRRPNTSQERLREERAREGAQRDSVRQVEQAQHDSIRRASGGTIKRRGVFARDSAGVRRHAPTREDRRAQLLRT